MSFIKIKSKFSGRCSICGDSYDEGDYLMWNKEEKTCSHVECAQDEASNEASPIKPVQAGVTARVQPPSPTRYVVFPKDFKLLPERSAQATIRIEFDIIIEKGRNYTFDFMIEELKRQGGKATVIITST